MRGWVLNPLNANSYQLELFPPYSINALLSREVIRIKLMITQDRL